MKKIFICILLILIPISVNFLCTKIDEYGNIENSYINNLKNNDNVKLENKYIDTNNIIDIIGNTISNTLYRLKNVLNSYSFLTYSGILAILFETIATIIAVILNNVIKSTKNIKYRYKMNRIFNSIRY